MGKTTTKFISFDIEASGRAPSVGSLLTLGAAVFDTTHTTPSPLDTFYMRVACIPLTIDASTMTWWSQQSSEARLEAFEGGPRYSIDKVLGDFVDWWQKHGCPPLVADPAMFDFAWLNYELLKLYEKTSNKKFNMPFGFRCIDGYSLFVGAGRRLDVLFHPVTPHIARDDAIAYGANFAAALKDLGIKLPQMV
jgi:hypothetical protein